MVTVVWAVICAPTPAPAPSNCLSLYLPFHVPFTCNDVSCTSDCVVGTSSWLYSMASVAANSGQDAGVTMADIPDRMQPPPLPPPPPNPNTGLEAPSPHSDVGQTVQHPNVVPEEAPGPSAAGPAVPVGDDVSKPGQVHGTAATTSTALRPTNCLDGENAHLLSLVALSRLRSAMAVFTASVAGFGSRVGRWPKNQPPPPFLPQFRNFFFFFYF